MWFQVSSKAALCENIMETTDESQHGEMRMARARK